MTTEIERPEGVAQEAWDALTDEDRAHLLTLPEAYQGNAAEVRAFLMSAHAMGLPPDDAAMLLVSSMSAVLDRTSVQVVIGQAASVLVAATNIAGESDETIREVLERFAERED